MKFLHKGRGFGGFSFCRQLLNSPRGEKCPSTTTSTRDSSNTDIATPTSSRHKSELRESNMDLTNAEGVNNSDTESNLIGAGCAWQLANQRAFHKKKAKGRKGGKKRGRPKSKTKKTKKRKSKGKKRKGSAKKNRHLKDIFEQYKK